MKQTFILLITLCITFMGAIPSLANNNGDVKALWVWDFFQSASTTKQRSQLLHFAAKNDINLLFVGTNGTLRDHPSDYEQLIQEAHKQGIRVFALAGKAEWALKEHHRDALEQVHLVIEYNSNHRSSPFDGVQLDIEPYSLPAFASDKNHISGQMLELLQDCAGIISNNGKAIELNAAIPFWYATGQNSINLEYGGESKPLSHHILDIVDSVAIMAYRNRAIDQIEISKSEVDYAGSVGKKAYIGTETNPPNGDTIPESITYFHNHLDEMNEQLNVIKHHYSDHPGFGGIAIHAYHSYKVMQERDQTLEEKFEVLKSAGILEGYADGRAGFGKPATRAETAVLAARLRGYSANTLANPERPSFLDVQRNSWYYGWVESAYRTGAMNGRGSGLFLPDAHITIEEFLTVIVKVIDVPEVNNATVLGASHWAQGWVQAAMNMGFIHPKSDYTAQLTREELVKILYEVYVLNLLPSM